MQTLQDSSPWKNYLDEVPEAALARLPEHCGRVSGLLAGLPEAKAVYAYAPGKWTVRQLLGHLLVSHRIFVARAVCIARGETQPLPGFEENAYARDWPAEGVPLRDLAAAYAAEAASTLAWTRLLRPEELDREGIAAGLRVRPSELLRALIGHETHHLNVLSERYGLGAARTSGTEAA